MNILVTGANGQLGNEMRIVSKVSQDTYIFTDVMEADGQDTIKLDITNAEAVNTIVKENDIMAIVNCAAYTNVDKAETDKDICELLNAKAPEILAISMKEVGGLLIHVSTDYVFGGGSYNTPCKEEQKGTPTGVYGLTKLHGEQNIQATGVEHVILRTAWLYSEFGRNFVKTILNLTATKPQVKVVFDQMGTPTYAYDLAKVIFDIVENRKFIGNTGVYHYSNEGCCSWYDFSQMIAKLAGIDTCDIQPCHSNEFPSSVRRPSFSVLDKTKIKETFDISVPYWVDSLKICIDNLMKE